jgi:putative tryptophan/tyrosine transport system substrate-binding protein
MQRRCFITLFGGAGIAWAWEARGQQATRIPRLGILSPGRAELPDPIFNMLSAFLQGLRDLGYPEGERLTIERQYANGRPERLPDLAAELVKRKPDIIVAFSTTAARPAQQATGTIPIVAVAMADPVADELVASLARPGGDVTGTAFLGPSWPPSVCNCFERSFLPAPARPSANMSNLVRRLLNQGSAPCR